MKARFVQDATRTAERVPQEFTDPFIYLPHLLHDCFMAGVLSKVMHVATKHCQVRTWSRIPHIRRELAVRSPCGSVHAEAGRTEFKPVLL